MSTVSILVVEDDRTIMELIFEVLDDQGYAVHRWSPGQDAVEMARRTQPDLIILDIWLGSAETGWTILERIRADADLAALPVIVCSADVRMLRQRVRQHATAPWRALEKPFAISVLLAAVSDALDGRAPGTS